MRNFIFVLFFLSTAARVEETRPLAKLPARAQESWRQAMLENIGAVSGVLALLSNQTSVGVACHLSYRT